MVFFTCFYCGDSVKKPAVEKHYNFKCKNEVALTCMDCLKDFDKHSYQGHTKCISEEERYSGKDYVVKESSNSGAKKQETWVDVVQSILQSPNVYQVTPDLKRCLQRLKGYDNVPRKKAKFENFVKNSFHIRNDQAEALWKLLEKALAIFKQEYEKEKQKSASQNIKTKDNSEKSEIKSTFPEQKDLKSKRKKQENDNHIRNEVSLKDDILNDQPVKKRKKKEKHQGNNESILNGQSVEESANENEPAKKKKKGRDQRNNESVLNGQSVEESANENEPVKKKKKKRDQGNNESVLNGQSVEESANENEPAKKKKKHIQENQVLESTENMTNNVKSKINGKVRNNIDVAEESVDPEQFDWKAIIFRIVSKKADGINIEKLKEKVQNKYKVHFNAEEISHKIEKTFNKKLKKISALSIENNVVKIKTK